MSKGKQLGQNGGRYTGASGACLLQLAKQSFAKTLSFGRTEALSLAESKEQHPDHSFLGLSPGQLGPVVMEVGGEFFSMRLTLGVTPSVSEARGLESGSYALPHLATASPVCGDYSIPLPDTLRSCRSTGLTMPSCLPQI